MDYMKVSLETNFAVFTQFVGSFPIRKENHLRIMKKIPFKVLI